MGTRVSHVGDWLHELRDVQREWLDVQACTEPADREEAEFGIALAYEYAGLTPPRTVIWAPDPSLGGVIAGALRSEKVLYQRLLWNDARAEARRITSSIYARRAITQAQAAIRFPGRDRVEPAIRSAAVGLAFSSRTAKAPEFDDGLADSRWRIEKARADAAVAVWGQHSFWSHGTVGQRKLGLQIALDAIHAAPEDVLQAHRRRLPHYSQVRSALASARGRGDDLAELALHDALSRLHTPSAVKHLEGLMLVARSAGWWWPYEDVAVVCERPSVRRLDREGRLHAEDGPALAYPEGFSAYFWHGRVVPQWAVMEPTVARIAAEQNVEVRRCAIEALGWARFTEEAGLKLVDECPDPGNQGQRLALYSVPGKVWGTAANVLVCTNGTVDLDGRRHTFGLLVPVTVRDALGAAAWGYGLTAAEYAGLERRA